MKPVVDSLHSIESRTFLELLKDRKVLSWALYDWANSAFATTVLAGFFPLFFKQYWSAGASVADSTARLGFSHAVIGLCLGFMSPLLGLWADRYHRKKIFLFLFTVIGVLPTAYLALIEKGQWEAAVLASGLATLGFIGAQNFYDALIVTTCRTSELNRVSTLGYGLGYLGGGVLFAINVAVVLAPGTFGIPAGPDQTATAIRLSFLSVAVWWALFSIPLFRNVPEVYAQSKQLETQSAVSDEATLRSTLKRVLEQPKLKFFLLGYFFYIDGINTIIKMSIDYGLSLGFKPNSLIQALLIVQFVGFPATLGFGALAQRFGPLRPLAWGLCAYVLATLLATQMQTESHFFILAGFIGLIQGAVQALSRSLFAAMIPQDSSGSYFGLYNLIGRFSSILGPALIAAFALITPHPRYTLLSVLLLLGSGLWLLLKSHKPIAGT